jgi:hypothetical protein
MRMAQGCPVTFHTIVTPPSRIYGLPTRVYMMQHDAADITVRIYDASDT